MRRRILTVVAAAMLAVASFGMVAADHETYDGARTIEERCAWWAANIEDPTLTPWVSTATFQALYDRYHCDEVLD